MPIIEIQQVSKSLGAFLNPQEILRDISLTLNAGEFVVLSGENGAGKSTLINLILGLSIPQEGTIKLMGHSPQNPQAKTELGVFFQDSTFPRNLKVREVIELISSYHATPMTMPQVVKKFSIQDLLDRPATELSGGQKKWLRLVLAFVGQPQLLILDEPTSDIDATRYQEFWQHLTEFHQQGGTILIVTHRPEDWVQLEKIATRSIQLQRLTPALIGSQLNDDGRIQRESSIVEQIDSASLFTKRSDSTVQKQALLKEQPRRVDTFDSIVTQCRMEVLQLLRTPVSLVSTLILIGSASKLPHTDSQAYSQFFIAISTMLLLMLCLDILGKNVSLERLEQWFKFVRTTPLPLMSYLAAKVITAFGIASLSLASMFAVARFFGYLPKDFSVLPVVLNQLIFLFPFAVLTLCLSYLINPKGYDSVSKLLFLGVAVPSALPAMGISLPSKLETAIHFSPFYHYFQLIRESASLSFDHHHFLHAAWMVWCAIAFSLLAVWSCQREQKTA